MSKSECVKVAVRCRPLNSKEKGRGEWPIVKIKDKVALSNKYLYVFMCIICNFMDMHSGMYNIDM